MTKKNNNKKNIQNLLPTHDIGIQLVIIVTKSALTVVDRCDKAFI